MLKRQFFRFILIISDLTAFIISLIVGAENSWYVKGPIFTALGSFLIGSWVMNLVVLLYTAVQLRRNARLTLPINANLGDLTVSDSLQMGHKVFLLIILGDFFFTVFLIVFTTLAFANAHYVADGVAGIGGIVSIVVHLFYVLSPIDLVLRRYRLQISFVRVDADEDHHQITLKESSGAPSLQEPEVITPRPYRGSPSTKPSSGSNKVEVSENPITLVEPTEGDSLIADHD